MCNLILYRYDPKLLPKKTYEKLNSLLSHTESVQKRKTERIELIHNIEPKTGLLQTASLVLEDEKVDFLIKDISLDGCQCVCFGKIPTVAAGVSSVALQISFTNPKADYVFPSKVLSQNNFRIAENVFIKYRHTIF